jgi:OmpA-OmpF porin, OOP family
VSPQSQAALRQAAKCITSPTVVGGHTDDRGNAAGNARLSQARAQAVLNVLVQNGAPRTLLTAQGFGPDKPVADNTSDAGRAKNRRMELAAK